ncbi:MAG: hypothetical protein ACRYF4_07570 [Janthinobacterium lividum]
MASVMSVRTVCLRLKSMPSGNNHERIHRANHRGFAALCLALIFSPLAISAQLLELSGGTSTLYQAQGASLTLHGAGFESGLSGGMTNGHFLAGAYLRHVTPAATYSLGLQDLHFGLPTDLFSGEHRLAAVGVGISAQRSGTSMEAFLGESSTRLDSPYVQGFSRLKPTAVLLFARPVTPRLTVSSQLLFSSASTALTSLAWRPNRSLALAVSGGFGGRHHYAAASLNLDRPRQSLQAEYISAGTGFHRTGSQPDLSPEFLRENVSYVFRSSVQPRFTLSVARQNLITAQPGVDGSSPISTVNQLSLVQQIKAIRLNGAAFMSSYSGQTNLAYTVSASFPVTRRMDVQNSVFSSHLLNRTGPDSRSFVTNFRERLTSRIAVSENFNYSGGQTSVGYGGSLQTAMGSLSVDTQTVYLPTRPSNPFQQTLMIDLQLTVLGRVLLHAGSFVSPTGKMLYTADAHAAQNLTHSDGVTTERYNLGTCLLRGRVVDDHEAPIVGAAIEIDGKLIFTDSEGDFFLRERKPTLHSYHVALGEFLDGYSYRVVTQPLELASSRAVHAASVIVVARAP